MKTGGRQYGSTLTEMTIVVAVVALLVGIALPGIRAMLHSFESSGGAKSMISAALASARAIAAKERRYAGIRFQKAYDPQGPLKAAQYMILIVHDFDKTGLESGFRAVEGIEPMKLPETVGVMIDVGLISGDLDIDELEEITNATTFSVIFSPSGKLVIHDVQVRNRDGFVDSAANTGISRDDVFNKKAQVDNGIGMFYQDDYFGAPWSVQPVLGLGPEPSRRSFVIYDREKFRQAFQNGRPYSGYLGSLLPEIIFINPYTGTMIEK